MVASSNQGDSERREALRSLVKQVPPIEGLLPNLDPSSLSEGQRKFLSSSLEKYVQENTLDSLSSASLLLSLHLLRITRENKRLVDELVHRFMQNDVKTVKSVTLFLQAMTEIKFHLDNDQLLSLSSVLATEKRCLNAREYAGTIFALSGLKWDELDEKLRSKYLNDYETMKEQFDFESWSLVYLSFLRFLKRTPVHDSERLKHILEDMETIKRESESQAAVFLVKDLSSLDSSEELLKKLNFR
jgi:hypothetical protein